MFYRKKIFLTLFIFLIFLSCATFPKRSTSLRDNIVNRAESYIGCPYKNGGIDPSGFDCSGFVFYIFQKEGILLPRSTDRLLKTGRTVSLKRAEKGDLIFFRVEKKTLHVGIYEGEGKFIHASSTGIRREVLNDYWKKRLIKIKRVI